jgi:hypothetical protein
MEQELSLKTKTRGSQVLFGLICQNAYDLVIA